MGTLILCVIGGFILIIIIALISGESARKKEMIAQKKYEEDYTKDLTSKSFNITKKIVSFNHNNVFAIDENNRKIAILKRDKKQQEIIPFEKIMGVEITDDNTTILKKSILGAIGGAVVGDIIAGQAGAIVGGLTNNTKEEKEVSKVQVVIKIRDLNNPTRVIDCFNCYDVTTRPVKPNESVYGDIYKEGLDNAKKIAEILSVVIDANDRDVKTVRIEEPQAQKTATNITDELTKLADLKDKGILTEEEFNAQKKLLLNNSTSSNV